MSNAPLGYQLLRMFSGDAEYVGSHAAERRAPADAVCDVCKQPENITDDPDDTARLILSQCSMCETWMCTPHYTMHAYIPPVQAPKAAWWKRVLRRG